jgi:DNA-binding MarR family transcriptional regulator
VTSPREAAEEPAEGPAQDSAATGPPPARPFPEDVISSLLQRLVRSAGLLGPHDHAGVHASLSEVLALRELSAASGLTQADLGEALTLEKSTVSRLVAGLERRGWVARERDPANRRYLRLALTAAGSHAAALMGAHLQKRHQALLSELTADELTALSVGLNGLARAIMKQHGSPLE